MAVKRLFQTRQQFFDNSGNLASGYRLFFYVAGQQTKQSTYNSSAGLIANSNPIALNSRGEPPSEVWGTVGKTYKIALAEPGADDPPGAFVWTEDNVATINDVSAETSVDQWLPTNLVPTFINSTSFSVPGDRTSEFVPGRRVKTANNSGTAYSTILTSAFTSLTTVTVSNDSPGVLDAGLNSVSLGIITPTNSSLPWSTDDRLTIVDNADTTKRLQFQLSGISTGTTRTITIPDADFTAVGTTTTQTLTNKTLTSPVINTPTLASATLNTAVSGTALATQSDMESAPDATTNKLLPPAMMKFHPGFPKAWGVFLGGSAVAQYGCTLSKGGTGIYTFTFTTAFSSGSYLALPYGDPTIGTTNTDARHIQVHALSTSSCEIRTSLSGSLEDWGYVVCVFWGDN